MSSDRGVVLELQEAADALGVHYQTAYRWVRTGKLPANMVGGRYLVEQRDLDAVDAARRDIAVEARAPGAETVDAMDRIHGHEPDVVALLGVLEPSTALSAMATAAGLGLVAGLAWRQALRGYTSASS